ncbi:MAG: SGNH/GDSL hydrolase family protein [Oxalobacteraceae bacterium]|nr:MAG: SGNH/GDSL hydrolase family protein [Oxalobacteraceae bacterium]
MLRVLKFGVMGVTALALVATGVLFYQGKSKPETTGEYVALGSSFAAGLGLGPQVAGSPLICMRSANGYPHRLARRLGLSLVDMSCSGSTTDHILRGGQVFLGPQLDAIGPKTQLVTITSGGNDVSYVSDLTLASGRGGVLGKLFWKGPKPLAERNFQGVSNNFLSIVTEIRKRAPSAKIVIVGYPAIVPIRGSCRKLGVKPEIVDLARDLAARLDKAARSAAERGGALFADMGSRGADHDVCSSMPWVNGANPSNGAPFHPTAQGAEAVADAVVDVLLAI